MNDWTQTIHSLGEKRLQVAFYIFFAWVVSFLLACFAFFHVRLLCCVFLHLSLSKMDSDNENQACIHAAVVLPEGIQFAEKM